jgi:hypothetical protein
MQIYTVSLQEYDAPEVWLYDNQAARDQHRAYLEQEYGSISDYHIETDTITLLSTFEDQPCSNCYAEPGDEHATACDRFTYQLESADSED